MCIICEKIEILSTNLENVPKTESTKQNQPNRINQNRLNQNKSTKKQKSL